MGPGGLARLRHYVVTAELDRVPQQRALARHGDLYLAGQLKLDELITARYPLEQLDTAIADME